MLLPSELCRYIFTFQNEYMFLQNQNLLINKKKLEQMYSKRIYEEILFEDEYQDLNQLTFICYIISPKVEIQWTYKSLNTRAYDYFVLRIKNLRNENVTQMFSYDLCVWNKPWFEYCIGNNALFIA